MTRVRVNNSLHLLNLSYVKRWVVAPTHRDQSVAEHTFRVICIAHHLLHVVETDIDVADFFVQLMRHDAEEIMTGDVPGPAKSAQPGYLQDVGECPEWYCLLKVADSIETGTFWLQWGNPEAWRTHTYNCAPKRDIGKIVHYSARIPGLLLAATEVWRVITGMEMEIGG